MKRTVQHCVQAALWLVSLMLFAALSPAAAKDGRITVFAAASLTTALGEIASDFTTKTGTKVVLSFAGSGTLARQIAAGAPVDLFISADEAWMNYLEGQGVVTAGDVQTIASNRLVIVQPAGDPGPETDPLQAATLTALLGGSRLAIADPDTVPAGRYGKASLQHLGLWQHLSGSLAPMENVRIALAAVSRGDLPLGLVYASDAAAAPSVKVLASLPEASHPEIRYPAATIGTEDRSAQAFLAYIRGPDGQNKLATAGFLPAGNGD